MLASAWTAAPGTKVSVLWRNQSSNNSAHP